MAFLDNKTPEVATSLVQWVEFFSDESHKTNMKVLITSSLKHLDNNDWFIKIKKELLDKCKDVDSWIIISKLIELIDAESEFMRPMIDRMYLRSWSNTVPNHFSLYSQMLLKIVEDMKEDEDLKRLSQKPKIKETSDSEIVAINSENYIPLDSANNILSPYYDEFRMWIINYLNAHEKSADWMKKNWVEKFWVNADDYTLLSTIEWKGYLLKFISDEGIMRLFCNNQLQEFFLESDEDENLIEKIELFESIFWIKLDFDEFTYFEQFVGLMSPISHKEEEIYESDIIDYGLEAEENEDFRHALIWVSYETDKMKADIQLNHILDKFWVKAKKRDTYLGVINSENGWQNFRTILFMSKTTLLEFRVALEAYNRAVRNEKISSQTIEKMHGEIVNLYSINPWSLEYRDSYKSWIMLHFLYDLKPSELFITWKVRESDELDEEARNCNIFQPEFKDYLLAIKSLTEESCTMEMCISMMNDEDEEDQYSLEYDAASERFDVIIMMLEKKFWMDKNKTSGSFRGGITIYLEDLNKLFSNVRLVKAIENWRLAELLYYLRSRTRIKTDPDIIDENDRITEILKKEFWIEFEQGLPDEADIISFLEYFRITPEIMRWCLWKDYKAAESQEDSEEENDDNETIFDPKYSKFLQELREHFMNKALPKGKVLSLSTSSDFMTRRWWPLDLTFHDYDFIVGLLHNHVLANRIELWWLQKLIEYIENERYLELQEEYWINIRLT